MREILYIQAGTLPNFVGTHFWNTQESYFQYEGDTDADEVGEPEINHDISFREGLSPKVKLQSESPFVHLRRLNWERSIRVTPHSAHDSWCSIEKVSAWICNAVGLDQGSFTANFGSSSSFGTLHAGGDEQVGTIDPQWFVGSSTEV